MDSARNVSYDPSYHAQPHQGPVPLPMFNPPNSFHLNPPQFPPPSYSLPPSYGVPSPNLNALGLNPLLTPNPILLNPRPVFPVKYIMIDVDGGRRLKLW